MKDLQLGDLEMVCKYLKMNLSHTNPKQTKKI